MSPILGLHIYHIQLLYILIRLHSHSHTPLVLLLVWKSRQGHTQPILDMMQIVPVNIYVCSHSVCDVVDNVFKGLVMFVILCYL